MAATVANSSQAQLGLHGRDDGGSSNAPGQSSSPSAVEPLPPAPRFKPSDFTLVRTLGTGEHSLVRMKEPQKY